jgi:hypothetical protein
MKVGFGKQDITPKVGGRLVGYRDDHYSTGVHDPLLVTTSAIEDAKGNRALIIAFDLLKMESWTIEQLATAVVEATGIQREQILFNCSHTHAGPPESDENGAPDGGSYLAFLAAQTQTAARQAVDALEPAETTVLSVPVNMAVNRNVILPNGEYRYFPDYKYFRDQLDGPIDPRPGVMLFRRPGTAVMIGAIINHNCHPVFLGVMTTRISADYVGYLRNAMTETTGAPVVFLQGHCGNSHPPQPESGYSAAKRYGESLAEVILDYGYAAMNRKEPGYAMDDALIAGSIVEELFEMDPAKADTHYALQSEHRESQIVKQDGAIFLRVRRQVLVIGEVAICGLPGEMVAQLALQIKWNSPFRHTWMSYFATDQIGYISHRNGIVHGGYEAAAHVMSPLEGFRMAIAYVEHLHNLTD